MEWVDNWEQHKEIRAKYRETNDCMVVSFAAVWDAPYDKAHRHMALQFKRKPRRGVPYKVGRDNAISNCPKTVMRVTGLTQRRIKSLLGSSVWHTPLVGIGYLFQVMHLQ